MDPPAYLTIHITFSLLPPLSTLHAHLQHHTIRFRVYTISQTFFTIVQKLKSFIAVPSIFRYSDPTPMLSSTDALALTVEAGLLLDQMIDLSAEGKSEPIPDEWIDEFEKLEFMIARITKEDDGEPETPCPNPRETDVGESPESMRTRFGMDSVFSTPRRDDSMSSVEDELPEYLCINGKYEGEEEEEEEDALDLAEEMRRVTLADEREVKVKVEEEEYDGVLDPALITITPNHEEVQVKEEEDDYELNEESLDPALRRLTQDHQAVEVKQEEEEFEMDEGLRETDNECQQNNPHFEGAMLDELDESVLDDSFENTHESIDDEGHPTNVSLDMDDEFDLEKELLHDDNRIFEQYHAITTPPRETSDEIDNSPFFARVIAEIEDLEPLETLAVASVDDIEDKEYVNGEMEVRESEDAEYEEIREGGDSEDEEGDADTPMRVEIRTSSPLFDDQQ